MASDYAARCVCVCVFSGPTEAKSCLTVKRPSETVPTNFRVGMVLDAMMVLTLKAAGDEVWSGEVERSGTPAGGNHRAADWCTGPLS